MCVWFFLFKNSDRKRKKNTSFKFSTPLLGRKVAATGREEEWWCGVAIDPWRRTHVINKPLGEEKGRAVYPPHPSVALILEGSTFSIWQGTNQANPQGSPRT